MLAKIRKASPVEKHLTGFDLVLTINLGAWVNLSPKQRIALLDHEFQHVGIDEESGDVVMLNHDLEEFGVIVVRHGLWMPDVAAFAGVIRRHQLELFRDQPAELPGSRIRVRSWRARWRRIGETVRITR